MKSPDNAVNASPKLATRFLHARNTYNAASLHVHMFTEDIVLSIMPYDRSINKEGGFHVGLQGESSSCDQAHDLLAEFSEYGRYSLPDTVCDAVHNIASHLSRGGWCVYEIVPVDERYSISKKIPTRNLFRLFPWYLQIIPSGADREHWGRSYTLIHQRHLWRLDIPMALGGARKHKSILRKISSRSHLAPNFMAQDIEGGKVNFSNYNLNFSEYIKLGHTYTNRLTKKWGWNQRDIGSDRTTEYYSIYKYLCFSRSQAILREHIIKEINKLFQRLSIDCTLIVKGLPSPEDVTNVLHEMEQGKIGFKEALDKARF